MSFDGLIEWEDDEPVIVTGLQAAVDAGTITSKQAATLGWQHGPDASVDAIVAHLQAHYRPDVAAELLAAAQPLMAIAWDEGAATAWARSTPAANGQSYQWRDEGDPLNPYRIAK